MIDKEEYTENTDEHERAPADFKADFTVEDTKVPDYPVIVDVDGLGEASANLASWQLVEDMQDGGEEYEFNAQDVADIISDHYESPDFSALNADGVRQMKLVSPDNLLSAIMPGMDAQMQGDGSARVDTKN